MKGLIVWAYSNCRSTMAFYRELALAYNIPLQVCLMHFDGGGSLGRPR